MTEQEPQEQEQELDLSISDVVTKYKTAATICNKVLAEIVDKCLAGTKVYELCTFGDNAILEQCGSIFKGKNIEKGVAFPTSVSLNNCVGYYCPLTLEDSLELKEGDLAKIVLGVHIDGFIATQAHAVVVPSSNDSEPIVVEGKKADLLKATQIIYDMYTRLVRPGNRIQEVIDAINKTVENFNCQLVEGVMTHQLKRFVIDGNKCILNRQEPDAKVEDQEFLENEVYAIDVVLSTGEGRSKVMDEKETTVYKRALDTEYSLKLKASRQIISEINKRYPTMPFTIRQLDSKQTRLGLVECVSHGLLHPYPVLYEKSGEFVAQIKSTVLLLPNGLDRITQAPQQNLQINSETQIDEVTQKILDLSIKYKKKAKKPKKKTKTGGEQEQTTAE